MTRLLAFLYSLCFSVGMYAHSDSISNRNDIDNQNLLLEGIQTILENERDANRYKMYPTENIYIFLKLDTQTGRIEQVQWNLDEDKEFTCIINSINLALDYDTNSFELYPTKNIYQFVLLDKLTGRTWHVQWGLEYKKRWIRRIN